MVSVTVDGIPDDVLEELRLRAARAAQTLQEFLLDQLATIARTPGPGMMHLPGHRATGHLCAEDAIAALGAERGRR